MATNRKDPETVAAAGKMQAGADSRSDKESVMEPPPSTVRMRLRPGAWIDVPNGLLRSALFGLNTNSERYFLQCEELMRVADVKIGYTGSRLDQNDLDVWEMIIQVAWNQKSTQTCSFTYETMLKMLGKSVEDSNREVLHACLFRLTSNAVKVENTRYVYIGGLIKSFGFDSDTDMCDIYLDDRICPLFNDQFSRVFS